MRRIALLEERKKLWNFAFASIMSAAGVLLLSHFLSLVALEYLDGGDAVLRLLSLEPSLLLSGVGWSALIESPFVIHAVLAGVIGCGVLVFDLKAIRTWSMLSSLHYAS
jgi:hypothetical protein